MNIETDLASCAGCNDVFKISEALTPPVELGPAPRGTKHERRADGFDVSATTRSAAAFFLVPFMCVWSGGSLGGIYGSQIASGRFDIVMSLFGIPFLLGSVLFWSIAIMAIGGRVSVTVRGDQAIAFVGAAGFGWRKRLRWSDVTGVRTDVNAGRRTQTVSIVLDGVPGARFGSQLSAERREFVVAVLRSALVRPASTSAPYR